MKFKLDENIGTRGRDLLLASGHDVETVRDEGLQGATDERLYATCAAEGRCLITLDHDFAQVLRFPPEQGHGIVVLELPRPATPQSLLNRLAEFLAVLAMRPLNRELWIVEPGRVRIHQSANDDL